MRSQRLSAQQPAASAPPESQPPKTEAAAPPCGFADLPLPLALCIFAALPADVRALCGCVCTAWRDLLLSGPDAACLWSRLDLSLSSGVSCVRCDAALAGAAALARGGLEALKLTDFGAEYEPSPFTHAALLRVLAANRRLRDLAARYDAANYSLHARERELQELLRATGPELRRLDTVAEASGGAAARALLRREPPYGAVHLNSLWVSGDVGTAGMRVFAADVAACTTLRQLTLWHVRLEAPAALDALIAAAQTRRLEALRLWRCTFSAGALRQLARLLDDEGSALKRLQVGLSPSLFENAQEADVMLFCAALQRNATLGELALADVGLQAGPFAALRAAVAARPAAAALLHFQGV